MPSRQHNSPKRNFPQAGLAWGVLGASVLYWGLFFAQPSLFGLTDEAGQILPRFFDLTLALLGEQLLSGLTGHGRFEPTLFDRLPILAGGIVWLLAAWTIGRPILRWSQLTAALSWLEQTALATLAGLACLSTWTLIIGMAGGIGSRYPLLLSVLAGVITSVFLHRRMSSHTEGHNAVAKREHGILADDQERRGLVPTNHLERWLARLMIIGVSSLAVLLAWGSMMTPFEFDVVEYHLQAPKEFLEAGAIRFNERNVYVNMPLAAEMHSLAWMTLIGRQTTDAWWWGGLIGKFIIGSYSLLAAGLVAGFVTRHLGRLAGWATAGCYLAVPGGAHVATAGLIDSVLGAYILAGLIAWSTPWPGIYVARCIGLLSLLAGAAAATKYPGIPFAVLPLAAATIGWTFTQSFTLRQRSMQALAMFGGFSVTFIPWLVKNWLLTGNPVYPLMSSIFGCRGLSQLQIAQWQSAHAIPAVNGSVYGPTAILHSLHQLTVGSPFHSPIVWPLCAAGLLAMWLNRQRFQWLRGWPWLAAWILLVWFGATHRIDRFWLPIVPLAAGLAGVGVHWLGNRTKPAIPFAMVLFGVAYCGFLLIAGSLGDNRLLAPLDALRNDAGTDELPGRLPRSTHWINNNLNPSDRVLLVGEARVFDFVPQVDYATCFNTGLAEELLGEAATAAEQKNRLQALGITHVLIHWGELARYRSPGNYGFSQWPTERDIAELLETGVVEPVDWPVSPDNAQLLRVLP